LSTAFKFHTHEKTEGFGSPLKTPKRRVADSDIAKGIQYQLNKLLFYVTFRRVESGLLQSFAK
jgi:hypothetical protein